LKGRAWETSFVLGLGIRAVNRIPGSETPS
jgi:hypothetical protein